MYSYEISKTRETSPPIKENTSVGQKDSNPADSSDAQYNRYRDRHQQFKVPWIRKDQDKDNYVLHFVFTQRNIVIYFFSCQMHYNAWGFFLAL